MKNYKITNIKHAATGFTLIQFNAYSSSGELIGIICANINIDIPCEIKTFYVKKKWRKKGIGRKLMKATIKMARKYKQKEIIVYPVADAPVGETPLAPETLYHIYKRLGYNFVEKNINIKIYRNKMVIHI